MIHHELGKIFLNRQRIIRTLHFGNSYLRH
jgi:hypothetical protein